MDLQALTDFANKGIIIMTALIALIFLIKFYRGLTPFYKTMVAGLAVIYAINIFLFIYVVGPAPGSPAERFLSGF